MSCSCSGDAVNTTASSKKSCTCFVLPTACCVKRPNFAQIETITAFNKIDQTVPCFKKVSLPGPSINNSSSFGNQVVFSRDANILVVSYARFDTLSTENAGSVYIFERRAQFASCVDKKCQQYALRQILSPPALDQVFNLQFGYAVAISSDGFRIAVGAPSFGDTISRISHDAVFVYDRIAGERCSSSPWKLVQRIVAQRCDDGKVIADNEQTFNFGSIVSLSRNGKVLIVGNTTFEDGPPSVLPGGSTYIYVDECVQFSPCHRQTGQDVFTFAQKITRDEFMANVGILSGNVFPDSIVTNETGNTIALSMVEGSTISGIDNVGIVQVYRRCGFGKQWAFNQSIPLSEPATATNFFGITMSMTPDGRYLVVETADDRTGDEGSRGYITVYRETCSQNGQCLQYAQDGNVIRVREQESDSTSENQQVAISDDGCLLAVGWEFTSVSGVSHSGKVDVYERNCTAFNNDLTKASYTLRQELVANQQIVEQEFGFGLALSGNGTTLAIGTNTDGEPGTVQVYCRK